MQVLYFLLVVSFAIQADSLTNLPLRNFLNYKPSEIFTPREIWPSSVQLNYLDQHVDNFDPQNRVKFQQRYYQNGEFFQPGGPLYIIVGGPSEIVPWFLTDTLVVDMAQEMKGYLFYLEHRYYGESHPFLNTTTSNLRFLNVDQALADLAHFITHIKSTYTTPGAEESPVIVVGYHYGGSLAVWFRKKYPHLALAAWASSAPLLAISDYYEYKEFTGAIYKQYGGDECYNIIENGFKELEQMIADGKTQELSEMFHLCQEIEDEINFALFFASTSDIFSLLTQLPNDLPVSVVCDMMKNNPGKNNAEALSFIWKYILGNECAMINYDFLIETITEVELDSLAVSTGSRQFYYQECSQLGWYLSSTSSHQPFGSSFPVEFYFRICRDIFGEHFDEAFISNNINNQNVLHGGLDVEVTNTIFTHGELDPWRTVGMQIDLNEDAPAFIIEGATMANDLFSISPQDHPQLVEVKQNIKDLLRFWITRALGIDIIPLKIK